MTIYTILVFRFANAYYSMECGEMFGLCYIRVPIDTWTTNGVIGISFISLKMLSILSFDLDSLNYGASKMDGDFWDTLYLLPMLYQ